MGSEFKAYLWGIETQGIWGAHNPVEKFKAYLWGIETEPVLIKVLEHIKEFKAYLWGIETIVPVLPLSFIMHHLKPTYEGLKQCKLLEDAIPFFVI